MKPMSSTCTDDCTEIAHTSTCRSRQRRATATAKRDATPLNATATAKQEPIHATVSDTTVSSVQRIAVQPVDPDMPIEDEVLINQIFSRKSPEPHVLTKHDMAHWRGSPAYYLDQDTGMAHLTCEQLHRRLSSIKQWQASPEYAERVYRLVHGLTTHSIPANMVEDGYKVVV